MGRTGNNSEVEGKEARASAARKNSAFGGMQMGVGRLEKIVKEKLEKHAFKSLNQSGEANTSTGSKARASAHNLCRNVFRQYDTNNDGVSLTFSRPSLF